VSLHDTNFVCYSRVWMWIVQYNVIMLFMLKTWCWTVMRTVGGSGEKNWLCFLFTQFYLVIIWSPSETRCCKCWCICKKPAYDFIIQFNDFSPFTDATSEHTVLSQNILVSDFLNLFLRLLQNMVIMCTVWKCQI
jgi:hypothetical protein